MVSHLGLYTQASNPEMENRERIRELFRRTPIPEEEVLDNLALYLRRQMLSRYLFFNELYQHILPVQGIVLELGVRWGQNMALLQSLRGIYEPFNHQRRIVGFDTFAGFPSVSPEDGKHRAVQTGSFNVTNDYESYLEAVLAYHESESPIAHIRKFEIHKGDAAVELEKYLAENPQTVIALAYFDMDLYEPSQKCLKLIRQYVTRGSVIGFDELNNRAFPGETVALREVLGLSRLSIRTSPFAPAQSYVVVDAEL